MSIIMAIISIIELDSLTMRKIAKYLDIVGWFSLLKSCRYINSCLNSSSLYDKIINNNIINKSSIETIDNHIFIREVSYIPCGIREILHGDTKLFNENKNVLVHTKYDKGKLTHSLIKDNAGRYTSIYINNMDNTVLNPIYIKLKYMLFYLYAICNGIKWRVNLISGELTPIMYTYKVGYAKYKTYYNNIDATQIFSKFNIVKKIETPEYIKKLMYKHHPLNSIIFNIFRQYNLLSHIGSSFDVSNILFDRFGNVKYKYNPSMTKYKNGKIIKSETLIRPFYPCEVKRDNFKYNITKIYKQAILISMTCVYNNYKYTYNYIEWSGLEKFIYTIDGVEYINILNTVGNHRYEICKNKITTEIIKNEFDNYISPILEL